MNPTDFSGCLVTNSGRQSANTRKRSGFRRWSFPNTRSVLQGYRGWCRNTMQRRSPPATASRTSRSGERLWPGSSASASTRMSVCLCTSLKNANEGLDTSTMVTRSLLRSVLSAFQHIERVEGSAQPCERIALASKVRLMSGPSCRTTRHISLSGGRGFSWGTPAGGGTVSCRFVLSQEEKNVYKGIKWVGNLILGNPSLA
ncbi:hypothetical protein H4582DRAFT_1939952, partial [Lactarius indigo]